jgi:hypothetical protein
MKKLVFILLLSATGFIKAEIVYLECKAMSKTADLSSTKIVNFSKSTKVVPRP